ncbi:hypothetical protein SAMN05216480_10923 [Pustulibacterium marinum]|uniref:Uncharacterized protein n=1 Tax=Pustulibacterium marinum TaxID=1224947 RepID=A0A1I7HFP3_9FLAO|nr:hypothetical protein SAMN05216480_10923 [Pustulibacterium marinum]
MLLETLENYYVTESCYLIDILRSSFLKILNYKKEKALKIN